MNKCNKCGYDYSGSGDSAHVCGPIRIQQRTEQEQQIETLKRCLFQMQEAAKDLVEQAKSLTPQQRTEPICPECKAEVLYECVACGSNNYPPQRTEQEPVSKSSYNFLRDDYNDLLEKSQQDAKDAKEWRAHVKRCKLLGVDLDYQITTPPTQPAQRTEQEPVAWRTCVGGIWFTAGKKAILQKELESINSAAEIEPLYTTPQPQEFVCSTGLCHYKATSDERLMVEDAVLAEREACAKVCDQFIDEMQKVLPVEKLRETDPYKAFYKANAARIIQDAIRARGNT